MQQEANRVVDQLEVALQNGCVPAGFKKWGAQLLGHLRNPIKIAFVGLPGSGKSSLINMMLGRNIVPSLGSADIIEVSHGPRQQTTFEFADGTVTHHDGLVAEPASSKEAFRARLKLTEPTLQNQVYTEIRLTGPYDQQEYMLQYAVQSAAIFVWCTENFDEPEQRLWETVPEEIKDHSFLALTKADQKLMKGQLQQRISELETIVSEEFLGLYPVATLQGIAAREGGQSVQQDLWKSSGGQDLCESIERQVTVGRAEDLDKAAMLLGQLVSEQQDAEESATQDNTRDVAKSGRSEKNKKAEEETGARDLWAKDTARHMESMLALLQNHADEMMEEVARSGTVDPSAVLDKCASAVSDLLDKLATAPEGDPVVENMREDARDGEEMLLLLQLEKGEEAATDAVSLMIQMKKEISEKMYGEI